MENKILFVYNAKSSPFHQAFDFFKRTAYPQTYQCNLTKLTHDGLNMKQQFQSFVQNLPLKAQFYHHDMFKKKYPDYKTDLPVVLLQEDKVFKELISTQELNAFSTSDELMQTVLERLQQK